jgi:hypothetical protein
MEHCNQLLESPFCIKPKVLDQNLQLSYLNYLNGRMVKRRVVVVCQLEWMKLHTICNRFQVIHIQP